MRQEAVALDITTAQGRVTVDVPDYLADVVATFSHLARASNHVNQRTGVSVRLSVANYEALAANALRRGLRAGERHIVARVDDLGALAASSMGKIEIESIEDGRDGAIMENLIKGAVLTVFKDVVPPEQTRAVVDAFEEGAVAHTGEDVTSEELAGWSKRSTPSVSRWPCSPVATSHPPRSVAPSSSCSRACISASG